MATRLAQRTATTRATSPEGMPPPEAITETNALVKALATMAGNLPIAALELREGRMSPERQRALGALIVELGELVRLHAELPITPAASATA